MSNEIKFRVLGDVKYLEDSLSKAKKSFDALGKTSAVIFASLSVSAFKFIDAAREQESAINALNQALKNSGNYTEQASKDLLSYASALQEISLFGDETIIQAQAAIAAFGLEGKILKDATKATLDLAQAKGMDLVSAAELVGKSIGSSTNALSRYGIEMDDATSKTDRAQLAIAGINKLFGGQAEAATKGLGSIIVLKNAFSDLGEEIGVSLEPSILKLVAGLKTTIDYMKEHPAITKAAAEFLVFGLQVTGAVAGVWAINAAFVAISSTLTGMLPLLTAIASNPIFITAVAAVSVAGVAKATWDWATATAYMNQQLEEQAVSTGKMIAASTADSIQYQNDINMKISVLKSFSDAETEAANQKIANAQRVTDEIAGMEQGMRDIAAITTQQEIDEYIEKLQAKMDAEIAYLDMQQLLYESNNALTLEKTVALEESRAVERSKFAALEEQAEQARQSKLSELEKGGLALYKKVNSDKIGSLQSTLQQAAQLNSKFANAYKAVAIGQTIVNTAMGIAAALSGPPTGPPWPLNIAMAALVGATGAVQIASIASQSFAVGSPEIPRDMTAQVHAGEMIVPATFSDAIRSGDLSLSGGGNSNASGGIVFDFTNTVFNGITDTFVRDIFEKASENIANRTLSPLPA